jgi:hypothetical protein
MGDITLWWSDEKREKGISRKKRRGERGCT